MNLAQLKSEVWRAYDTRDRERLAWALEQILKVKQPPKPDKPTRRPNGS